MVSTYGAIVTTPLTEVVPMVAPSASLFAVNEIELAADTVLSREIVAAEEVIVTEPEVEVMLAFEPEVVVMFPEPESLMFPEAWRTPAGSTEVPPLIVRLPDVAVK